MGTNVFKPGDRCGDNEIVRLVGSGGFAEVYEVIDANGVRRALKTLATDAEARPKLRARLAQEGTALRLVDHPNVVRLFETGFHDDRCFLVMELVEGRTLRDATEALGGRVPPRLLAGWIMGACQGVAAAHEMGVVHRDLKPENILLTDGDVAKVIDFGIAKLGSMGVQTTSEQRVGTAMYMAPEHMQRREVEPRMDIYSIGLVLYEALTGAHPIVTGSTTLAEVCARQIGHRPRPLVISAPWVPAVLAAIVDRAIEKDPDRRQPSMQALADALRDAIARMPPDPPSSPSGRATKGSAPGASSPRLGVTAPLSPDAIRSPTYAAATAPVASPPLHALATAEMPGTGPIDTTAPDAGSDRVGTLPPSERTLPSTLPSGTAPVARAAPRSEPPPPIARAPRMSNAKITVTALALVLGVGGGAFTAVELTAGLRLRPAKAAPKAAPASKPGAPRR